MNRELFQLKNEVENGIERVDKLLKTGLLLEPTNILNKSVFIEVLVHMKDLLKKSEKLGHKISFTDDVNQSEHIKDVSDLICNFRDAACHSDSFRRKFEGNILSFNILKGKGVLISLGDLEIGSKYDDDIIYNFGPQILYVNRHLIRAFNELKDFYLEYFKQNF